jgi:uncharacterized protein (TIGR02300 family)
MAKPELGTKRVCAACNLRFYDLHKTPIVCPTCAAVFVIPTPAPPRAPRRPFAKPSTVPTPVIAEEAELRDDAVTDDAEMDGPDAAPEEQEEKVGDADDDAGVPILDDMDEDKLLEPPAREIEPS